MRVFPLSNWTELDVWEYIRAENIPVVPLYFAKERPVVERNGALIMADDDRLPLLPGETPQHDARPLSHARLLSANRCDPLGRRRRSTLSSLKCANQRPPNGKAASSITTNPARWRRRSARAISDGRSQPAALMRLQAPTI